MSSNQKPDEYNIRLKGVLALETVIKKKQNIKIIEKCIHNKAKEEEDYELMYKKFIYQIIGDIINGKDLKDILNDIKKKMIGWNHTSFKYIKNKIEEHDEFIINPFEVEEGVTICKCGSNRVFTYSKQVRSCDEPMTTFARCVICKAQWTYSG